MQLLPDRGASVDQARINLERHISGDIAVQLTGSVELSDSAAIKPEVSQPVGSLPLTIDRIGQSLPVPKSIRKDLTIQLLDHFWNRTRDSVGVPCVTVRIQNKQTLVYIRCQSSTPIAT